MVFRVLFQQTNKTKGLAVQTSPPADHELLNETRNVLYCELLFWTGLPSRIGRVPGGEAKSG